LAFNPEFVLFVVPFVIGKSPFVVVIVRVPGDVGFASTSNVELGETIELGLVVAARAAMGGRLTTPFSGVDPGPSVTGRCLLAPSKRPKRAIINRKSDARNDGLRGMGL